MTTLLVLWLVATVSLAVLLGVIMLLQRVWPTPRRPARPVTAVRREPKSSAERAAA